MPHNLLRPLNMGQTKSLSQTKQTQHTGTRPEQIGSNQPQSHNAPYKAAEVIHQVILPEKRRSNREVGATQVGFLPSQMLSGTCVSHRKNETARRQAGQESYLTQSRSPKCFSERIQSHKRANQSGLVHRAYSALRPDRPQESPVNQT